MAKTTQTTKKKNDSTSSAKTTQKKQNGNSYGKVMVRLRKPKRTGMLMIRAIKDPESSEWLYLKDKNGNDLEALEAKFPIHNDFELDLSNPHHKSVYNILLKHPVYYNTEDPKNRLLDIENLEQEAEETITHKELEHQAVDIIKGFQNDMDISRFARVLGIPTKNRSETYVRGQLYKLAEDNPQKVIDEHNDPNLETKQDLMKALDKGVVTKNNGLWYYYEQFLGDSFERALSYVLDNDFLIPKLKEEAEKAG